MLGYNAPSKKAIKDSIASGHPMTDSRLIETSIMGNQYTPAAAGQTVTVTVVGPDPERNRKWYAQLTFDSDGHVIKVK